MMTLNTSKKNFVRLFEFKNRMILSVVALSLSHPFFLSDVAAKEPLIDGSVGIFQPIETGSFTMGDCTKDERDQKNFCTEMNIKNPFQLQSTEMTQILYAKTIDLINEYLKSIQKPEASLQKFPSVHPGDLKPVESVSWDTVTLFHTLLTEASSKGNDLIQNKIKTLYPGHQKGDLYRKPTAAEWEYVLNGENLRPSDYLSFQYYFPRTEADLVKFAWINANSEKTTHEVAQKIPFILHDRYKLYDMLGNVSEWVEDDYRNPFKLREMTSLRMFRPDPLGGNPLYSNYGSQRTEGRFFENCSYSDSFQNCTLNSRGFSTRFDNKLRGVGFRLVRSKPLL